MFCLEISTTVIISSSNMITWTMRSVSISIRRISIAVSSNSIALLAPQMGSKFVELPQK